MRGPDNAYGRPDVDREMGDVGSDEEQVRGQIKCESVQSVPREGVLDERHGDDELDDEENDKAMVRGSEIAVCEVGVRCAVLKRPMVSRACGTELAYGTVGLRDVRYCARVWCYRPTRCAEEDKYEKDNPLEGQVAYPICLCACYAMSGTGLAYDVICLRACYAMSGTGLAFGTAYAMPGTENAYGVICAYSESV
eukprot:2092406-Rhodomonas_salina.1